MNTSRSTPETGEINILTAICRSDHNSLTMPPILGGN
jgi:hypothetical protein